jgi:hypothetical protein
MKIIIVPGATDDVLWRFNDLPKRWVQKISSNDVFVLCPLDKLQIVNNFPKKMGHQKTYHPTMVWTL